MTVRVGINGFGRIGRSIFRARDLDNAFADIEIVAVEARFHLQQFAIHAAQRGGKEVAATGLADHVSLQDAGANVV